MEENVHSGHRERVRKEFLKNGFDEDTPPHKIMEMLLFYSIPRKDTNEIAHELVSRFGSIAGIIDAPVDELVKVNGVNTNTAALIKLIMPVARRYMFDKKRSTHKYTNIDEVGNYLLSRYMGYSKEVFSITSFSGSGSILGFDILSEGDVSEVSISTRTVIEAVLKRQAVCAIIAHNHPDGVAVPSDNDIAVTENIKNALAHINVRLLDHLIIADGDYVSMAQSRLYKHIFE